MKDEFNNAAWSQFWLIFWCLAILMDAERREKEKLKKQERKRNAEELAAKARRRSTTSRP